MRLRKLSLFDFKNYERASVQFSKPVNCIVGDNGSGKTNLLDAIYYLSLTKSAFGGNDAKNIRHGHTVFFITGEFENDTHIEKIGCRVQEAKKLFTCDKVEYQRLADHIGKVPVVLINPYDIDIIRGGSELRRKFFDVTLGQLNEQYLVSLLTYNRLLKQRNAALKHFAETGRVDHELLDVFDVELLSAGRNVYQIRNEFIRQSTERFLPLYREISEGKEKLLVEYISDWNEDEFEARFRDNRKKDILLQRTSQGIHRDDYMFTLDGYAVKSYGSQGQQKSFLLALKWGQAEILKEVKKKAPILLLDDVCDKLDDRRINKLIGLIKASDSQVFISDAQPERIQSLMVNNGIDATYLYIYKGIIEKIV
ncbi:MAG: DNA replication/repair protein RecF [Cyclobacteriaceae bacterium]|nr:DNA replication/repair protein RecF [Cyclobacteriaceae bacterium]